MKQLLYPYMRLESLEPRKLAKYARSLSDHWERLGRPAIEDCPTEFRHEYARIRGELARRGTQLSLFS